MKNTKMIAVALPTERSAAGADLGADRPNPEVVARPKRRRFDAEYKQRVLAEADKAKEQSGGVGALLRREGLYSSHLVTWRQERAGRYPARFGATEAWPQVPAGASRRRKPEVAPRQPAPYRTIA